MAKVWFDLNSNEHLQTWLLSREAILGLVPGQGPDYPWFLLLYINEVLLSSVSSQPETPIT